MSLKKNKTAPLPPTFELDGEQFKFRVLKFYLNGTIITAEDAIKDEQILQHLVDKRSGLIKEIF